MGWLIERLVPNTGVDRIVVTQDDAPVLVMGSAFPSTLAVYDARTGARLDPLSDQLLEEIGNDALAGTRVGSLHQGDEFNRYYTIDRVPAGSLEMEGVQPSEVVLSRASGRTLRRTDPAAAAFEKAYARDGCAGRSAASRRLVA